MYCEENECCESNSDNSDNVWICNYCDRDFIEPEYHRNHENNCRYYYNKKFNKKKIIK